MDLISAGEKAEFFAAMKDLADTFYKHTVAYKTNAPGFDRFETDRANVVSSKDLLCRVTTTDENGQVKEVEGGHMNYTHIKVEFNREYLLAQGMIDGSGQAKMNPATDYLVFAGRTYMLTALHYDDSDFAGNYVIVALHAELKPEDA